MSDPIRLRDDDGAMGRDLAAFSGAKVSYDVDQGRAMLAGSLATAATATGAAKIGVLAKLGIWKILGSALLVTTAAAVITTAVVKHGPVKEPVAVPIVATTVVAAPPSVAIDVPPPIAPASIAPTQPTTAPRPTAQPPAAPAFDLRDDTLAMAKLRTATGDPSAALVQAEDDEKRFALSPFNEDREQIAIAALMRLGRKEEARTRAKKFLAAHPSSPLAERVRTDTGL